MLDPRQANKQLRQFESVMQKQVIGQPEAVCAVVDVFRTTLAQLSNPNKPLGTLLFLGPTGTGKTRVVEAAALALFGNPRAMLKVDCAEFQHSHEIAKLVGSPPGYLGHRETHPYLCADNLMKWDSYWKLSDTQPLTLLLFDEIEKANDALWNLLLGVLDKGSLTLGDNKRVGFERALIFLTSNLGAREIGELTESHRGFSPVQVNAHHRQVTDVAVAAARRKFSPEFMNRIDKTVVFRHLTREDLRQIVELELLAVQDRIIESDSRAFFFECSERVKERLMEEGFDTKSGARHLKRVIERRLVQPFSNLLVSGQIKGKDWLWVDEADGEFTFEHVNKKLPMAAAEGEGMEAPF